VVALPHDELGSGPALVLLHAGIADRRMWRENLRPLADAGHRVVALDLPGFGEAPAADEAPWDAVIATLAELEIERCVLVGNSFGGAIAQRVALLAPERVRALVLVSSPVEGLEPSDELQAAWEAEEAALEEGDVDAAVVGTVETWTLPDAPPELREQVAEMQRRAFELQSEAVDEQPLEDPLEDYPDALARVDAPALVIVGERDMVDFRDAAGALATVLRAGDPVVIAGAGHLAPLEQPHAFREALVGFLEHAASA
jgi:pimeloyl-ACP methyl ester carboxylesterase